MGYDAINKSAKSKQRKLLGRILVTFFIGTNLLIGYTYLHYGVGYQGSKNSLYVQHVKKLLSKADYPSNRYPDEYTAEDGKVYNRRRMDVEYTPWPKPKGWNDYGYVRIWKHFQCRPYSNDGTKPLPTLDHWQVFRDAYIKHVDESATFDDPIPPTEGYTMKDGQPVPFIAKHGSRGRGLFATRDITKGEIVHDGGIDSVPFPNAKLYRNFVFNLPRNRACDFTDWHWTQQLREGDIYHVYAEFTITMLWNSGNKKTINVNPPTKYDFRFIALRDILKGEELLYDYSVYDTSYDDIGL